MIQATWYFDVISPFAYMQAMRLSDLPNDVAMALRPVLFAGLLNHWGQLGPAEIAPKKTFTFQHSIWRAKRMGIEFKLPSKHPFNPLRALRLAVAMNDMASIQTIFRTIWVQGEVPDDEEGWSAIQTALGIKDGDARIDKPEIKSKLILNGEEALTAGVFGVPTIVANGELFWGDDAFEMFLDYCTNPEMMATDAMREATNLVPSSERKR